MARTPHFWLPRPLVAGLLAGLAAGCSGDSGAWPAGITVDTLASGAVHVRTPAEGVWAMTGAEPWRIVEELRIGVADGEGPYLFGSVRDVIPDAQGRIWVMDSLARELRLFGPDGTHLRTVGGSGEGPGEFASNPCAFPGPNQEVWVEDSRFWLRFDAEGGHIASVPRQNTLGCGMRQRLPDDRLALVNSGGPMTQAERQSYFVVYTLTDEGQVLPGDTFPTPPVTPPSTITWTDPEGVGRMVLLLPFAHRPGWFLGPMGDFFMGQGEGGYGILRSSLAGDTLLIMERPHEPLAIDATVREEAIEAYAQSPRERGFTPEPAFTQSLVSTVYPPFNRFFVGADGTVWVGVEKGPDMEVVEVFAADGRFLGRVEAPDDFHRMGIQRVEGDHMYGVVRDELGVGYAVRLRIERN